MCLSNWAHFATFLLSWKWLLSEAVTHSHSQGLGSPLKPKCASGLVFVGDFYCRPTLLLGVILREATSSCSSVQSVSLGATGNNPALPSPH